jgi:4-diphosphocytidyl-2-C-methyl-D-erythritol kinase
MSRLSLKAHAKLNLNLRIVGRRLDGYHDLESIFQSISLHDRVTLEATGSGITLEVDAPGVPEDGKNLAWRAAAALPGHGRGVHIRLEKGIPVAAGLGGGSSDAAATLIGASRLWGLDLPPDEMASIASGLGSDVPYFLTGGTALVSGRGERVDPLPDRLGYELLVVHDGTALSTAEVYSMARPALTSATGISRMARFGPTPSDDPLGGVGEWVRVGNDLEPSARHFCPAIGEIKDRLLHAGAVAAAMTGSGSAVFGVFVDSTPARRAARDMEARGYMALCCAPLGRQEYQRNLGVA